MKFLFLSPQEITNYFIVAFMLMIYLIILLVVHQNNWFFIELINLDHHQYHPHHNIMIIQDFLLLNKMIHHGHIHQKHIKDTMMTN
jgi:hypothetical protein